jgi:hypothetical protein
MVYHFLMACANFKSDRSKQNQVAMELARKEAMAGRPCAGMLVRAVEIAIEVLEETVQRGHSTQIREQHDRLNRLLLSASVLSSPRAGAEPACVNGDDLSVRKRALMMIDSVASLDGDFGAAILLPEANDALTTWSNFVYTGDTMSNARRIRFLMDIT